MTNVLSLQTQGEEMLLRGQALEPRFDTLVRAYYDYVYNLAGSILNDSQDAEDAAQDTFIDALLYIECYRPGSNLRAWLATITVHKRQSILRKRKARQILHNVLQAMHDISRKPLSPIIHHRPNSGTLPVRGGVLLPGTRSAEHDQPTAPLARSVSR